MMLNIVQKGRVMMHHTMKPNMDHAVYIGMAEPIRKTHAFLTDEKTMAQEIDRVIVAGVQSRLPVYIYVPTDVVSIPLDADGLKTPLDTSIRNQDSKVEDRIVEGVLDLISKASSPAILADVLAIRHGGQELTRKLVELTHFPSYSCPLSKGVIDETSPYYNGLYNGTGRCTISVRSYTLTLTCL
jgi:pyruvate decarboxylase